MSSDARLERHSSLGYQTNHLARLFEQALRVRISPHGVVPGQFAQLLALYEQDGLTQRELCERVRIDASTMAHTLKRMERDGLVRRLPDPTDGRRTLVTLTDHARKLEPVLTDAARDVNALAAGDLEPAEVTTLLVQLYKLIDRLESDGRAQDKA